MILLGHLMRLLLDKHAPLLQRTITVRPHARWYNEQLRDAKHVRRQLERKWRHSKTESDHEAYRKQCSIVAKELYTAKTEFYSNKIIENQGDYKALFNIANTLLVNQNCATMPSSDDDSVLAELFSNFFVEKISKLRVNFTFDSSSGLDIAPLTDGKLDCLRLATSEEIQNTILSASNSSCALDPIPTWLLKQCIPELLPIITAILNTSLRTGSVPALFKYAIIRPHLKKSSLDTEELKNYRPVSNLHFMSKVLEKLVVKRLENHMCTNNLYDPLQSAYRSQHSTETAILKIHNDIIEGLDAGKCTVLSSLDLSAAFDTVDHTICIRRLSHLYGVDGTVLQWFESFLSNRDNKVCVNDVFSLSRDANCGVPQGSVLGARLYTMYVYPLTTIIRRHGLQYHTYADDTQIYLQCDNHHDAINAAIIRLQNCILEVIKWMTSNALKINEEKTEFIIFNSTNIPSTSYTLQIGDNSIPMSGQVKILGVTLDSTMTLDCQIAATCRSSYMHIRRINTIRQYLTNDAVKTLTQSLVTSRLDYCNIIYNGLPMKSIKRLQLTQNAAARLIRRIKKRAHITPVLRDLHWLPVVKRCQFKILVFTYKSLKNEAPSYISDLLNWYHPNRPLRSANTTSITPKRYKSVRYGKRLMDTGAAMRWNSLPNELKCAITTNCFKKTIKTYLFNS